MATDKVEFRDLMARARQGDENARKSIVTKYGGQVLHEVRRHLAQEVRRLLDSVDVVQCVWRSFFARQLPRRDFDDDVELRRFLRRMAEQKAFVANRHFLDSHRLDLRRVLSLEEMPPAAREGLVDPCPSPAELAQAREALQDLIARLPPSYGRVVTLLYDGYTNQEIAEMVGCTERTVERIVSYVQRIC